MMGMKRVSTMQKPSDNQRMNAVRQFVDNVLRNGSDRYHEKPIPLLADGIHRSSGEHLTWKFPDGSTAVISNLACQQNFLRVLTALTNLTGDPQYKKRTDSIIRHYFRHYQDQYGLLFWGGHRFIDLKTWEVVGPSEKEYVHELKNCFPSYSMMYEINPKATVAFLKAFWNAHVCRWDILEISRHGRYGLEPGELWNHSFANPPSFQETTGLSFLSAGNDLIYAGLSLFQLTGDSGALLWAKRLREQYAKARHPHTKLGAYLFTQAKKVAHTDDDSDTRACFGDRAKRQFGPEFGDIALEGNLLLEREAKALYSENALMILEIAPKLNEMGADLIHWVCEGMAAYAQYAYIPETNQFKPLFADGTDLTGYQLKRNGYYGNAGDILKPFSANNFFVAYARGFLVTHDERLWDIARGIARANNLGDIGQTPGERMELNLNTSCDDPYALFAVLDIYKQTSHPAYLELARKIGDNLVQNRFHDGYFLSNPGYEYVNIDTIEPYALLALEAVIKGKADAVPPFINGSGYIDGDYLAKDGSVITIHSTDLYEKEL